MTLHQSSSSSLPSNLLAHVWSSHSRTRLIATSPTSGLKTSVLLVASNWNLIRTLLQVTTSFKLLTTTQRRYLQNYWAYHQFLPRGTTPPYPLLTLPLTCNSTRAETTCSDHFPLFLGLGRERLLLIFVDIELPIRHKKEKKRLLVLYIVLVEFSLDCFVPSTTLIAFQQLGGGQHHFDFDYVGLALWCFNYLLVHHASATCPLKFLTKPITVVAPTLVAIIFASTIIKDLLKIFQPAPLVLPSPTTSPTSIKDICAATGIFRSDRQLQLPSLPTLLHPPSRSLIAFVNFGFENSVMKMLKAWGRCLNTILPWISWLLVTMSWA